jgi:peptide/nickel transport system substrate-binding protein
MSVNHVRRRTSRLALLSIVAAVGTVALVGCTASAPTGGTSADGGVLTVAASAAVTTWDPVRSFSTEALYLGNLYEPLLWKNAEGAKTAYTPGIADKWETSADGKTWTFSIRKGATFHDGEKVDAAAVKASIEAAKDHAGASFIWAPLESIETPDAQTVVMKLSYPAPMDLVAASTYGAWIVAPKALAASAKDDKYFEKGIDAGSGPYTLKSYTPGKEVVLQKYDHYWNKDAASHYKIVDIQVTSDAVTAQQMLTSGEVKLATNVPLENVGEVAKQIGGTVRVSNSPFNFVGYFNTLRAPLDNVKVRQALSYAMPYDDIITVGGSGYGTQAHGPVPKGVFPYSTEVPQYHQNLEKAKALLAEAGHPGGGFTLKLTYSSENPAEARFVPLIKDALAKIGVTVDVRAELFNQQWEEAKSDPANAQDIFVVYYWPTYSDAGADNLNSLFRWSEKPFFNLSYWKNDTYNSLLDAAAPLTATDRKASQAKYVDAMKLLVDQAPGAFFYDVQSVFVKPKSLEIPAYNENYPFTMFFAPITATP